LIAACLGERYNKKNLGRTTMLKEKKRERERERLEEKKRMKSGTYMMLIGF